MDLGQIWRAGGGGYSSLISGRFAGAESADEEKGWGDGGGALAEGRKIYEMIGGRALFGWTVARNKSRGFRVSST